MVATIEDKEVFVKEKVENPLFLVSSIQGQLTSSLSLSKTLVTNFSVGVHSNLKNINTDLKNLNPNALRFTRAQFGPGILTPYLEDNWDKIPSTLPAMDVSQTLHISMFIKFESSVIRWS